MSTLEHFPVVLEKTLPVAERAWHGGRRWLPGDLPSPAPGLVFVFVARGEHLLRERPPARTSAVSVVDVRPRTLTIEIELSPPDGTPAFRLRAAFRCRVTDPVVVTRLGLTTIFPDLDAYLRTNLRLGGKPEEIQQRLLARFAVSAPEIAGMEIRPTSVQLSVVEE